MKKYWFLVAGIAVVLAVLTLAGCSAAETAPANIEQLNISSQQEGIWVSGQGKVTVTPDIANLRLGIEAEGTSVTLARDQAAAAMESVMNALTENGIARKDIQTRYFNIRRLTRWDRDQEKEIVIGYRVTNTVTVKVRNLDELGTIIDDVAGAGGDLTRIDNIDFTVDDPSPYYDEAREEAVAEAKDKAEQLARLAGVTLGKATYISEGSHMPPVTRVASVMDFAEEGVAIETPISPGELEISLTVQVVYAIK